jgi:glutamine amidotransferase
MTVAIVEYNGGNTRSVANALHRLGVDPVITGDPAVIAAAERVIFPGVGNARPAMARLRATGLDTAIAALDRPFLGICLGMQLLCTHSEEDDTDGLGIFDADVRRLPPDGKVPHMGWNRVHAASGHPLFAGLEDGWHAYFVHSYCAGESADTIARVSHTVTFSAAMQRENFYAVQFHPEKSAAAGSRVLANFLSL